MGDFNVALDPELDTTSNFVHRKGIGIKKREVLQTLISNHDLTDVWRAINPKSTRYTVRTTISEGHTVLTRTDLFLASPSFLTSVSGSNILDSYCSDHNPLSLNMVIGEKLRGKGYWKFPEFLLSDPTYEEHVKTSIAQCIQDNPGANPGLLWDTVKTKIRGCTIDYLSSAKRKRKSQIEKVETEIHTATCKRDAVASTDPTACSMYVKRVQELQKELDTIYQNLKAPFLWKKGCNCIL